MNGSGRGLALALGERIRPRRRLRLRLRPRLGLRAGAAFAVGCGFAVCAGSAGAQVPGVAQPAGGSGQSYLLVVGGIGGEPRYSQAFHAWGGALVKAAVERHGLPRANVTWLAESPVKAMKDSAAAAILHIGSMRRVTAGHASHRESSGRQVFIVARAARFAATMAGTDSTPNITKPSGARFPISPLRRPMATNCARNRTSAQRHGRSGKW